MRTSSVTIGLLLLGAAVALVNCGGDDSSPTGGTGGSGGSGATGGSSGGTGGTTGGSAGTGGSTGGGMDSGTAGGAAGSSGAAGSGGGGKGGSSGAAGAGGKGGSSGAAGSSGKGGAGGAAGGGGAAGKAGSAGAGMPDGGTTTQCPAMQPIQNEQCNVTVDCFYGPATCTCVDPGPDGNWTCSGGPPPEGGTGNPEGGGMCPVEVPGFGDPCPDSGFLGPCIYESGHTECKCVPADGWGCIRH